MLKQCSLCWCLTPLEIIFEYYLVNTLDILPAIYSLLPVTLNQGKLPLTFKLFTNWGRHCVHSGDSSRVGEAGCGGSLAVMEVKLDFRFQAGEMPTNIKEVYFI